MHKESSNDNYGNNLKKAPKKVAILATGVFFSIIALIEFYLVYKLSPDEILLSL